jgi:hypothetical protein
MGTAVASVQARVPHPQRSAALASSFGKPRGAEMGTAEWQQVRVGPGSCRPSNDGDPHRAITPQESK